jgi:hypothetical protein
MHALIATCIKILCVHPVLTEKPVSDINVTTDESLENHKSDPHKIMVRLYQEYRELAERNSK